MSVRRKKLRGDWGTNNCIGSSKLPSPDVSFTMSEGWGLSNRELELGASSPRPKPAADGYRKPTSPTARRQRDLPDPVRERPSFMKRRARQLLHQAARLADASTLGDGVALGGSGSGNRSSGDDGGSHTPDPGILPSATSWRCASRSHGGPWQRWSLRSAIFLLIDVGRHPARDPRTRG